MVIPEEFLILIPVIYARQDGCGKQTISVPNLN